jgi:guanidinopropionase
VSTSDNKLRQDIRPLDASVPRFSEIATFLRAPHTKDIDAVDVGIFGIPTDQGVSFRTGTRHGPAAIREASRFIRRYNPTTRVSPFDLLNVVDLGDVDVSPYSLDETVANITALASRLVDNGTFPLGVGGDHVIPLPMMRGVFRGKPLGLLHIDAHPDTNDEFYGSKINHATAMRRLHEEGVIDPKRTVQLALRGTQFNPSDAIYGRDAGFQIITMDDYEELGRAELIERLKSIFGDEETYITIDVDGLDPRDTPGTPVPEPGGLSMRDCQMILRGLQGLRLVGADVCEVAPHLDPSGVTALNAANLVFELTCLFGDAPRVEQPRS